MKSFWFSLVLLTVLLIGIYIGNEHLFFTDYFSFFIVFSGVSFLLTVTALLCDAADLDTDIDIEMENLTE